MDHAPAEKEAAPSEIRTIGITTGGGDCPGLNAVIRAVVKSAVQNHGWEVLGIRDGFNGLIGDHPSGIVPLGVADVSGILPRGGTILGTTNRGNPFSLRTVEDGVERVVDLSDHVIDNARRIGIDALVVVGGDGTQRIGLGLYEKGLPVVGVPKTIDNDLSATDVTFGFDTALHVVTDALDRLHTTADSHRRVMLVEVMGRDAGWIALHGALAGGAHVVLIPEIPSSLANVCDFIRARDARNKRFTIIVVAEGIRLPPELSHVQRAAGEPIAPALGKAIGELLSREVRTTVLGHTQRGGSPSPLDRILSTRFGAAAVELIAARKFGHMVALRGNDVVAVDLGTACLTMKAVDPAGQLVRTAREVGISFGD